MWTINYSALPSISPIALGLDTNQTEPIRVLMAFNWSQEEALSFLMEKLGRLVPGATRGMV
jgi:hypothetical protein